MESGFQGISATLGVDQFSMHLWHMLRRDLFRLITFLSIIGLSNQTYGQSQADRDGLNLLENVKHAREFIQEGHSAKARNILDSTTTLFSFLPDSSKIKVGFEIGQAYRDIHLHEAATPIFEHILKIPLAQKDSINYARGLFYLGNSYKNVGLLNRALDKLYLGLSIAEKQGDTERTAAILSQIGSIKKEQKSVDESIVYYKEALIIAREMNDQNMVSSVLNNIGSAYKQLGDYSVAKEYFLQAIQINKALNNRRNLSYNYNNLANVFEETSNLYQALEYQQKSIDLKTELNDQPMLASSYYNLALIYLKLDSFDQAKTYIQLSKKLAKQFNVASIIPVVYSEYSQILAQEGNHQKAFLILSELNAYRDSLELVNKAEQINEMESEYRRKNLLTQRESQERELENSESNNFQRNTLTFLFSLCTALLILVFGLYYLSSRKRSQASTQLNQESERIEALNDKIHTQNSRIDDLTGRLELLQRDKNIYFSSVSHDMRGPLNAISAILELLKVRPDLQGSEEILVLDYSTRSLTALVEDILDVSYLEAGKLQIEHKTFSLRQLIQSLIDSFEFISNEKEIDLILDIGVIPDPLVGDPKRLNQILFNLLENAFKFTKDGFVKISVQSETNGLGQQDIVIEIEDSGIGIANSKLDLIFDKFYRASGEAYKDFGGSGIGLFVTQALIQQMSGTLDVKSSVGEGSSFTLKLTLPKG